MVQLSYLDIREAAISLIARLENMSVHHGQERYYSKEEMLKFLEGVYELATAISEIGTRETN